MPVLGEWSTIRKLFYPETGFWEAKVVPGAYWTTTKG